mmetsp:Transcript_14517/g.16736  ORF Transcript_14517/g.16736 Transcript_14517/m.16736 type:complete len:206 (-) Transcript_14517:625-1242(-)
MHFGFGPLVLGIVVCLRSVQRHDATYRNELKPFHNCQRCHPEPKDRKTEYYHPMFTNPFTPGLLPKPKPPPPMIPLSRPHRGILVDPNRLSVNPTKRGISTVGSWIADAGPVRTLSIWHSSSSSNPHLHPPPRYRKLRVWWDSIWYPKPSTRHAPVPSPPRYPTASSNSTPFRAMKSMSQGVPSVTNQSLMWRLIRHSCTASPIR